MNDALAWLNAFGIAIYLVLNVLQNRSLRRQRANEAAAGKAREAYRQIAEGLVTEYQADLNTALDETRVALAQKASEILRDLEARCQIATEARIMRNPYGFAESVTGSLCDTHVPPEEPGFDLTLNVPKMMLSLEVRPQVVRVRAPKG